MAGKSKRFNNKGYLLPKFLLNLGSKTVIQRIVECYSEQDTFHFIISTSQEKQINNIHERLLLTSKKITIHVINDHDYGPAYSVLSIINKIPDEPFIINYCDFLINWDYAKLKTISQNYDSIIPTFTGFHPASFGETLFAYIKSDSSGNLIQLREKQSFTLDRVNEPASTGTYYFKEKKTFIKYANEVLNDPNRDLPEAYVSLLANPMVRDGLSVKTFNVDKFICLGTPYDYEQYLYWFNSLNPKEKILKEESFKNILSEDVNIIPVAGKGSRFIENGFKTPKPLLIYDNKLLIEHSLSSMPNAYNNIIISRLNDFYIKKLDDKLNKKINNLNIINLSELTKGQLDSCLAANQYLEKSDSILISSCDYSLQYNIDAWLDFKKNDNIDVAIWTNQLKATPIKSYNAFAYCNIGDNDEVFNIAEKKCISDSPWLDPMVVGTFWFKKWDVFLEMNDYVQKYGPYDNAKENYIGTNINYLIKKGLKVKCFWVDRWISYGDPFEYEMIHYWAEYFRETNTYDF